MILNPWLNAFELYLSFVVILDISDEFALSVLLIDLIVFVEISNPLYFIICNDEYVPPLLFFKISNVTISFSLSTPFPIPFVDVVVAFISVTSNVCILLLENFKPVVS